MQAIKGNRAWPSWLLQVPPGQRKADEGWPVGECNRCSVCRNWHYVQNDAMGSLHVGQKSWETKILRREVLSVVVGNSTFATPETLARIPYLKAWLRETLRLYPVLSAIPRRTKEDIVLLYYHIPGGTAQVEFLVHQMGWDEGILEDAEAFKPEKWLRNKDTALIESAEAFASLPFRFGTRMCLGRRIAELELHLLMARIVQQFDISYPPEAENVEPFMRGVTIPDRPVRVQFVDRKWVRFSCCRVHTALQHCFKLKVGQILMTIAARLNNPHLLDRRYSISHIL